MKPYLFFFGSGASVPFGLPTMKEMVDEFDETLQINTPVHRLYNLAKTLLKNGYGYVDLESIFSAVDITARDVQYRDLGPASAYIIALVLVAGDLKDKAFSRSQVEKAKELTNLIKEFVRQRCSLQPSAEVDEKINLIFGRLFEVFCNKYGIAQSGEPPFFDPRCAVYTTNYDMLVELFFQGRSYINDLWKNEKNIKTLDVEKREAGPTTLIKLHGSLNWFQQEDGTIVNLDSEKKRFGNQNIEGEVMLYPIRQKDLYLYPWFNLFYRLKSDLNDTFNWIVIGYSFNDEFIRNIFTEIMKSNIHKMLIVDPDAEGIIKRHFDGNDNVVPIVGKFEDDDIASRILQNL